MDAGTAYGMKPGRPIAELTEVGPGTPMGELMRRYWHPVGLAGDATGTPRKVRILSEDLILFRDGAGRPGLVYPRCCHRGTTLYYGKVEERGIRCCYHGWLFDVEGRCLEQPTEPEGGRHRDRVRQPWYPVQERYGLIHAYLGPPAKKPVLPRFDVLEQLDDGEFVEADDSGIGTGGFGDPPCNWLQHYENVLDPFHVPILHAAFSGTQFVPAMAVMPEVEFSPAPLGVRTVQLRKLPDGRTLRRVTEVILPTLRVVASPTLGRDGRGGRVESIGWVVPVDDTNFRVLVAGRVRERGELARMRSKYNGKWWHELSEEEHQMFPGDWEAQVGQGPITLHSEEHLVTSDKGIAMLRRMLLRQVRAVAEGGDPVGVAFTEDAATIRCEAGSFIE